MTVEVVKVQHSPRPEWHVVVYDAEWREVERHEEFWDESSARKCAERLCS